MNVAAWYDRIGAELREERRRRGWTQADVGAVIDATGASVSRYERGIDHMKAHTYLLLRREGLIHDD